MKLNLGCGNDKRHGYINIDCRLEVNPDLLWNLEIPLPFPDNSVEEILAKDIIEHFSFRKVEEILRDWYRVLKPGGKIYIQCPDLEAIAIKVILSNQYDYHEISYWIYGEQNYNENFHKTGFTIPTLKRLLEKIGFKVDHIANDDGTNIICHAHKP